MRQGKAGFLPIFVIAQFEQQGRQRQRPAAVFARALKITGPGAHDIFLVLPAGSATISVKARYDADHGATSKPQVSIMANGELGVSAQTVTMTAAADTWETLTFSAISPTSKGVVRLRLESRAGLGTGNAWFDTISVT